MKKSPSKSGRHGSLSPESRVLGLDYQGSEKLLGKAALITGADSGIGRSVAVHFAREGADVAVLYRRQRGDAEETRALVEKEGRRCLLLKADIGQVRDCQRAVQAVQTAFGRLDILVNNAAVQYPQDSLEDISLAEMERTFRTNIYSCFYMSRAALKWMRAGASIINTTSVTAYRGTEHLLDYSSSKGAIVSFTRSLSLMLAERGIRVNAVAPGAVWTPMVASTMSREELKSFGQQNPMKRPGQPEEIAPCFVFLASRDASFMSGQVLHPNGGEIINT